MKISYTNVDGTLEFSYMTGLEISIVAKDTNHFYKVSIPSLEIMISMMKHHQSEIDYRNRLKTGEWK